MSVRMVLITAVCLMLSGCDVSNTEAEKVAGQAAEQWLTIVDSGAFEESWAKSATLFQAQVSKSEWVKMLENVRQPLGANLSRSLEQTKFTTSLPGAPDAEYVLIKFDASFEHKESAIEQVTVVMSGDGKWKVLGYFIK